MRRSLGCLVLVLTATHLPAENWPCWRGPRGDGSSLDAKFPLTWSPTENVRWKLKLPGPGNSSPAVWGDRVFLTQSLDKAGKQRAVLCIDRKDGKVLWRKAIPFEGKEPTHGTNPYCAATPVTDGERVIASHGSAGVVCYDLDGNQLWHRDLGAFIHIWGTAASPILHGDNVILNCGPGERTFLLAMDKKTGKDVWKLDIPGGDPGDDQKKWTGSWSTARVVPVDGKDQILVSWPGALKAHDPKTGAVIWECKGLTALAYTSVVSDGKVAVAMSGYGGDAVAVKLGGTGDVTATHRLWHHKGNPQRIGSGVIVGDHFYMANAARDSLQCFELQTGKNVWAANKEYKGQAHWGSIVQAGDKLLATDQDGTTFVIEAKPEFKLLGRNELKEHTNASLAISDGDVFVRTFEHLWCLGKK